MIRPTGGAFAGASLWIGTRVLDSRALPISEPEKRVVRAALADSGALAITLCPNIWFRGPLDTGKPDDLALLVHEAVHLRDCHSAGLNVFLNSYLAKAIAAGNYNDIVDEVTARRFETATMGLLLRYPGLVKIIASSDNDAIIRELKARAGQYRAAVRQFL